MADLMDKVVIITGASAGIGAVTAKEFAKQGSKVVLVARRELKLKDVADACADLGLTREKILVIVADVTKEEDVKRIIKTTSDTFTTIDVLVNNVGGGPVGSFEECSLEAFDQNIALNLRSVFMMCKEALPYLVQSKGSIVNNSTVGSLRPKREAVQSINKSLVIASVDRLLKKQKCICILSGLQFPALTAYCVAKAGLDHLTRNMAKEFAPKGVRVNIVSPGPIKTDICIAFGLASTEEQKEKFWEDMVMNSPMGRYGIPEEVAKTIVFIASGAASYVTGAQLTIDGGFHLA